MAFGLDEPALDGNIRRVLARVFDVSEAADSAQGERRLWDLALRHLPKGEAGDYNQALMDLGSTVCVPVDPRCNECPVRGVCKARRLGVQANRPVRKANGATPQHVVAAAVIIRGRRVLMAKRPSKGLLGGMWEFPNGRVHGAPVRGLPNAVKKHYQLEIRCGEPLGIVRHAYSHYSVVVHAFRCKPVSAPKAVNLRWIQLSKLDDLPMGRVDRQIAGKLA